MKSVISFVLLLSMLSIGSSPVPKHHEFYFARLQYTGQNVSGSKAWDTDYPAMDNNLVELLKMHLGIDAGTITVKADSEMIFLYPLIYAVEPEQMQLSPKEISVLKRYFANGGTLLVNDFHGDEEMAAFMTQIRKVLPDEFFFEMTTDHSIFHDYYDINTIEQVLNDVVAECQDCDKFEGGESGRTPHFYAMQDRKGNINVIMAWNNDLFEGIENISDKEYPAHMAVYGAKMAVNMILYVLTH